jgi:hypothetical protein
LRGHVTDESGGIIPAATITLAGSSGPVKSTTSKDDGAYSFAGLTPGAYTVRASAPQLVLPEPIRLSLQPGVHVLDLRLLVAAEAQHVTVEETGQHTVSADPSNNASALVLSGDDLQALADDPEDLAADLQALAGPSAGPNGGSILIDGFSGGELPPKDQIREIRVNQNPFSPEYDKLGYGRIEVFTKPGANRFHGTAFFNFGDDFWNSRNPYAGQKAPFLLQEYGGNVTGPLGHRASFVLDVQRHSINNGAIIDGSILDPATLAIITPYTNVFLVPQRRVIVAPRLDYQLTPKITLVVRYGFLRADVQGSGVGSFNLVSQGYHAHNQEQHVQVTETAVLGTGAVNETRFQFFRAAGFMTPDNGSPAIQVIGAFTGGGSPVGHASDAQNNYEFQNYSSIARALHAWRFGVRLRRQTDTNVSPQNFNGTFTFGGVLAPRLDANNQPVLDPSGLPVMEQITSVEQYRRTLLFQQMGYPAAQIRALGGGASQFTISGGNPTISGRQTDVAFFAGDDWRLRPNLTVSLGVRYEAQTNIRDSADVAPRVGMAWAVGGRGGASPPRFVLRAGFGIFYDRFSLNNTLTAMRYDGVVQQLYVVTRPDFFPLVPPLSSLQGLQSQQNIQEVARSLRSPYILQSALGVERQLPHNTTVAFTYANSHGLHQLRSQDINAPLPGTYDPLIPGSGVYPQGAPGAVLLMESTGLYNQNQWIANVNSRVSRNVSLFGSYVYNRALSNTDGFNTLPAVPYSSQGEYGPAATDIRNRGTLGGTVETLWGVRLSPLLTMDSGPPFNITVGRDLYGDTLFNGRPGIAVDSSRPGVIPTEYGLLDPNPLPGEPTVDRNSGRGPGAVMLNLRVTKVFAFGGSHEASGGPVALPGGGGAGGRSTGGVFGMGGAQSAATVPGRRFNLSISMSIRNLLNHNNPGPIVGAITSPIFGHANQAAGAGTLGGTGFSESANNRRLELQTRFTF